MDSMIFFKEKGDSKIVLISSLYITSLLANLAVGYRYISLGSFTQSGGIFIFPLSLILSAIITEIYGSILAKKLVYYGISCQLIFAFYAYFVVHMPAPKFLLNQSVYFDVFNQYLYFSLASTISIWMGSYINIKLLSILSDYINGSHFATRSFIASTIGEFFVTSISMLIANFNRVEIKTLIYMIICCFIVKTIISFIAIFPASIVVYKIKNQEDFDISLSYDNIKKPIKYFKLLLLTCGKAKGCKYNLEAICVQNKKVHLYNRGSIVLSLHNLIFNHEVISNLKSSDASHIGYYYSTLVGSSDEYNSRFLTYRNKVPCSLKNKTLNIIAIERNGKLIIEDIDQNINFSKLPIDIYHNENIINKFTSLQALYIGYLSGLYIKKQEKKFKKNSPLLKIVK
ncbi:VUT family protein [Legionella spiritensis]|uniref:VUT family protein n=1 Tax=Legionella spiritensis TaxID=452 RepID=UPI000F6CE86F|nr:VUT family protein [Legionella spiritensis]VEG92253.1 conserved hypothetical integral membrane protein [Legionella spiritensis]